MEVGYRRHMDARGVADRLRTPAVFDWLLAGTLAVLAQAEIWLGGSWGGPRGQAAALALLITLALGARRRAPLAVLGVVAAGSLVGFVAAPVSGAQDSMVQLVVVLIASYSTGAYASGAAAYAGAIGVFGLAAAIAVTDPDPGLGLSDIVFFLVLLGTPWAAGVGIRRRRASEGNLERRTVELERDREERAREAVAEERARIARELHDVVAHGVSVMTLQAQGGARVLDSEPEEARRAFTAIEDTGRRSLVEMRRLLGMLRRGDDELPLAPQPSLAQLDALVAQVRAAGLPVEIVREGEPAALPPGVDLSAFRIVQEALTNALKHAGPAQATVIVRWGERELELEVVDSGNGAPVGDADGGHGLVGMRERASVFGGTLEAGHQPEGGYLVRVRLPLDTVRP
jgi:signal transduction histidine kinase